MSYNNEFWNAMDKLIAESEIIIDRPRGSAHPRYPEMIYKVDYGYLKGTSSMDGGGIDVWLGTDTGRKLIAVICTVDLIKKDSEIKLLIGCTAEEVEYLYNSHNDTEFMKGLIIYRDTE